MNKVWKLLLLEGELIVHLDPDIRNCSKCKKLMKKIQKLKSGIIKVEN